MPTRMIIAEKPKAAEKIAKFLGANKKKYIKGIKVPYYSFENKGDTIIVVSAVGHVYSLREVKPSHKVPVFDIKWTPAYMDKKADYTKDYIELIKQLSKDTDEVISACDYDVEGSLIGFNVIRFATGKSDGYRMKFSALTKSDIVKAYENLMPLDFNNAYAGETRHILDWYWGINLSRALMHAMRRVGMYKVLSIGRVQGPALDILVKREKEILDFKPVPYWQLYVIKDKIKYIHEREKFFDEEEAKNAHKNTDINGYVEDMKTKTQRVDPPAPFDLTSLQIEAYRVYKMSPKEVLALAQNLYENSYISYPRTSSQKLPSTLNLKGILENLKKIEEFRNPAEEILFKGKLKPHQGKKDDPAHPAIHPTGIYGKMSEREKKLYNLIVRRFLACFGEYAEKKITTVKLRMGKERYIGKGIILNKEGWIKYYRPFYKDDNETLPKLNINEEFKADKKKMDKKETQPPKRYTPTSLVKVLEKKNLGTKTTRAMIIDTLFKRQYIDAKSIQVTDFGMKVHDLLEKYCPEILDENLTRKFEEKIEGIQQGKEDKERVVEEAKEVLKNIIDEFMQNEVNIGRELKMAFRKSENRKNYMGKCPKCGNDMIIRKSKTGSVFVGCTNFPNCRNTYSLPVEKVEFVENCKTCGAPVIKYRIKRKTVKRCLNRNCPTNKG